MAGFYGLGMLASIIVGVASAALFALVVSSRICRKETSHYVVPLLTRICIFSSVWFDYSDLLFWNSQCLRRSLFWRPNFYKFLVYLLVDARNCIRGIRAVLWSVQHHSVEWWDAKSIWECFRSWGAGCWCRCWYGIRSGIFQRAKLWFLCLDCLCLVYHRFMGTQDQGSSQTSLVPWYSNLERVVWLLQAHIHVFMFYQKPNNEFQNKTINNESFIHLSSSSKQNAK